MPKQFDPRKFIDREFEQELFEQLLQCRDTARILTIRDQGGMGKSHLLEKFEYRCRTVQPRTPVSFVALDQLPDQSPLALVQTIARNLRNLELTFPTFDYYEAARKDHDFTTIRGAVDLRGANLSGATIDAAGIMTKIGQAGPVTIHAGHPVLTSEQQVTAQETSVRAFLNDLAACCSNNPAVLLLDAYEKCDNSLQDWLVDTFLENYFFNLNNRPPHLLLVLAGRELPSFELRWPDQDCAEVIKSVRGLSQWTREHVAECLRVHGFTDLTERNLLDALHKLVELGYTPFDVVNLIETGQRRRR